MLRNYQTKLIQDIRTAIAAKHKRIVAVSATGSGKTVVMAEIARLTQQRGGTLWIVVHLDPLVDQTVDKLRMIGVEGPIGFIKAGRKEDPAAAVTVASAQTMAKRQWWRSHPPTVILWDECHESAFSTIGRQTILELFPDTVHVGFTATPCRLKKSEGMADIFTELVQGPLPKELQAMGHLCPMTYYAPDPIDTTKVRTQMGDFKQADLLPLMNTPEAIALHVDQWQKFGGGLPTLAFCVNVAHARAVLAEFHRRGITAALIVGPRPSGKRSKDETPVKERAAVYQAFDRGDVTVLVSVNVLSIGFDSPRAAVGLLLRPTKSLGLFLQQVGRVMRPHPSKSHGIIIDPAGNCTRHRLPEDLGPWSLTEGQPPDGEAPRKVCPECSTVCYAAAPVCPTCGYIFPVEERDRPNAVRALSEVKPTSKHGDEDRRRYFVSELRNAYHDNVSPGRATVRYKQKYGEQAWPKQTWKRGAIFGGELGGDHTGFWRYLSIQAHRRNESVSWAHKQWKAEFGSEIAPPQNLNPPLTTALQFHH